MPTECLAGGRGPGQGLTLKQERESVCSCKMKTSLRMLGEYGMVGDEVQLLSFLACEGTNSCVLITLGTGTGQRTGTQGRESFEFMKLSFR